MDNFTSTVTNLINNRLGKAYPERVSAELVESMFKFKDMNRAELASLFANLANETKIFSTCQDEIECETVQDMVDIGLVSFEWRDHNPDFGHMASFEKYASPLLGVRDINNKYSDAFYKCFRAAANNSTSDLFVCFDINKMAQHRGLCELDIFPRVAKYLINGLGLDCILESLPVKPCRRKNYNEVWCQLVTVYENDKVEKRHAMFIQNTPVLGRSCSSPVPSKIRVYFAVDDAVDMSNPWGSCPILHNGSNFRVPDYSRYFNEFTDAANDDDNVNNTCFIYSQKHPTLEIPSKLNIEAEVLMRGIIDKSDTLFVEGVKDEKLAVAMGMCHPKARVRHVALFFFSIHLPLTSGLFPETKKCSLTSKIRVGSDALITTPNEVMYEVSAAAATPADEENARGEELPVATESEKKDDDEVTANATAADPAPPSTSTPSPPSATSRSCFTKNSISRKMSISSYTCLACNDKCTENQRLSKPVHIIYNNSGFSNIHFGSSSCYQDPLQQQNRQHLSHGRGYKLIDLLAQSDRITVKQFANIISPAAATSSNFNINNCERSAMCHNFFCEGIEPVKTDFSSDDITKNKLVLYGKVLDVISSFSSSSAPHINRRRVFYGQEEKEVNKIPTCSDDAKAAFKDILVHECNKDRVERYLSNTKLGNGGDLHHRWWLKLPELTADFKKHVERFYTDCVTIPDAASLKSVFSQFYRVCKKYKAAKAQLLCCRENGERRPADAGEEEEEEEEEVGEREEGDGEGVNDESKNTRLLHEVVDTLVEFHARDEAITSTMIHKSMLLGSRTVVSGARCVVSTSPRWKFEVRQYVISMAGSAVTKVSDDNLKNFTPVRGAVSVTTAPNDKLPFGAHQTWRDSPSPDSNNGVHNNNINNNGKGSGNFNNGNDGHNKERNVNEPNWRVLDNNTFFKSAWNSFSNSRRCRQRQQQQQQQINQHKLAVTVPVTTSRTASNYSSNKYIPPHRRQQQQQHKR